MVQQAVLRTGTLSELVMAGLCVFRATSTAARGIVILVLLGLCTGCSLVLPLGPEFTFEDSDGSVADGGSTDAATPGPGLVFVMQPRDGVAGEVLEPPIEVEVRDSEEQPIADAVMVTIALQDNPGGAVMSGTTTVEAVDGVAVFADLSLNRAAPEYTLVATADGYESKVSEPFAVSAGAPVRLAFVAEPETAEGQLPLAPVAVAVEDAFGNTVASASAEISMALAMSPTGESLSGTTSVPAINGISVFEDVTLALPGDGLILEASSPGLEAATSAEFRVRLTFQSISAGSGYTCGVTVPGFAYCWGSNSGGRLGDGTEVQRETPTPVAGGLTFETITAGSGYDAHTCGITTDHSAYCWGSNRHGKLGNGTTADQSVPMPVAGGLRFASVSAGEWHSCGVTTANVVYCWGENSVGAVGDGTTTSRNTPTAVDTTSAFATVSAGPNHSCGLTTLGTALCWGSDAFGQLGNGSTPTTPRLRPSQIVGYTFMAISTGGRINDEIPADSFGQTCGVAIGGAAYCWGLNDEGRLGDGTTTSRDRPELVSGDHSFAVIETGLEHTCGANTDGDGFCWGANYSGQLGDLTTSARQVPEAISGGFAFRNVTTGADHSCGLTAEGLVYCWGGNWAGQLGDGSLAPRNVPQPVAQ